LPAINSKSKISVLDVAGVQLSCPGDKIKTTSKLNTGEDEELYMKSTYKVAAAVIVVMAFLVNPTLFAWGVPVPGRWEKVAETKPGDWMTIYTRDGAQHGHRFMSLNDEFLTCKNDNDEQFQYGLVQVNKIVLPKSVKYGKEWALWGALGGAAITGVPFIISHAHGYGSEFTPMGEVMIIGITTGIGALGGLLAGSILGAPGETVYISKELAMNEAGE
jgi:hypothetical protein